MISRYLGNICGIRVVMIPGSIDFYTKGLMNGSIQSQEKVWSVEGTARAKPEGESRMVPQKIKPGCLEFL